MQSKSSLTAALLAILLGACGSAAATPIATSAVVQAAPAESVRIVERLSQRQAASVPDVTGASLADAEERLRSLDLKVTVIKFGKGAISAQWPDPGQPRPADRTVVVWTGQPPQPPVVERTPVSDAAPAALAVPPPPTLPQASAQTPAQPQQPAPGGRTPGLETMVPPPHPPRANIRTLPEAEPGTRLSGRASWYGPGFAGHTTACGGVFDPGQLTLASRELRCGTTVTVTGPSGRSVEATVTDWGPAEWTNRRFDLSQATFAAVAGLGAGVVDVTVEVR